MKKTQVTLCIKDPIAATKFMAIDPRARGELASVLMEAFYHLGDPTPPMTEEQTRFLVGEFRLMDPLALWAAGDGQVCVVFISGERWKIDAHGQQTEIYAPSWK